MPVPVRLPAWPGAPAATITAPSDRRSARRILCKSLHGSIHGAIRRGVLGALALGTVCAASIEAAPLQGKPDQVFYRNARGDVKTDNGTITENTLSETVIEDSSGDEQKRSSDVVVRVVLQRVPAAYDDGSAYMARGDFENAAAKFRLVAGDDGSRPVVKAHARLMAANALMERGKIDAAAFGDAKSELETFLSDHADNRDVPIARMLHARAARLSGDAEAAFTGYSELFGEAGAGTPTTGYPLALCYEAGIAAVETALSSGNTEGAQTILGSIESSLPAVLAALEEADPDRERMLAVQSAARLGEGWVLLAGDQASQAATFFRTQVQNAEAGNSELRFGALLGLGESLLAAGEAREAQLALAKVSSLDFSSRDRVARALTGLAACALQLPDANARGQAKAWVQTVLDHYADTPAVLRANELAKGL